MKPQQAANLTKAARLFARKSTIIHQLRPGNLNADGKYLAPKQPPAPFQQTVVLPKVFDKPTMENFPANLHTGNPPPPHLDPQPDCREILQHTKYGL
jgi:hypothetical protein